jgi:3-mercaptopyruvate sulfurtransferase SseA
MERMMTGIMLVSHVSAVRNADLDNAKKMKQATNSALLDWRKYAELRGLAPVGVPRVFVDPTLFSIDGHLDAAIHVEGWCKTVARKTMELPDSFFDHFGIDRAASA